MHNDLIVSLFGAVCAHIHHIQWQMKYILLSVLLVLFEGQGIAISFA
jgi:hypothetical protein